MQRVKRSTAVAVLPSPPVGGTAGYFAQPNPGGGIPATVPGYEWFNNVQEELVGLVLAAGLTLADNDPTQLVQALIKAGLQGAYFNRATAGGTADAITATFTPAITALTNGMILYVRAGSANTTTAPTFTPNSGTVAAKAIVKGAGAVLTAGDVSGAGHWLVLQYDQTLDKWVLANPATGIAAAYFLARDEKSSGTNGGSSVAGVQTRTLNTVSANTISGASLSSNQITLPAGTYRVRAHSPSSGCNLVQAWLWNVTDSTATVRGTSENGSQGGGSDPCSVRSWVEGRFTLSATKVFELRMYTDSVYSNTGLGACVSQGTEVYSVVEIFKEA
ncbi:hypothetical protein [Accumulibacter sp.]|uniref:hypothetical protein n=1 Tax=Accumulibacter sp. TaxID=2053492 RepID=UPI0025EE2F3E|nr:hypothetical protein [Accumulibacter sp.]MCM8595123.1 hypothetical protein [Accumulibacter sp.]MCM8625509.1 hypothetical protein [Accumulibacter sp.]MDS4049269.1 hypothetical protein [Accumulibacter sp.]